MDEVLNNYKLKFIMAISCLVLSAVLAIIFLFVDLFNIYIFGQLFGSVISLVFNMFVHKPIINFVAYLIIMLIMPLILFVLVRKEQTDNFKLNSSILTFEPGHTLYTFRD